MPLHHQHVEHVVIYLHVLWVLFAVLVYYLIMQLETNMLNQVNSFHGSTAQRKVTGERGPATELEPGTYTLSRSFSHTSHRSQPRILWYIR